MTPIAGSSPIHTTSTATDGCDLALQAGCPGTCSLDRTLVTPGIRWQDLGDTANNRNTKIWSASSYQP